ncbi:MAG: lytic transglycosylase domain-containing protein [Novosphingobium sp.]
MKILSARFPANWYRSVVANLSIVGTVIAPLPVLAAPSPGISTAHPYAAFVTEAAQRFGIPEGWIWSVMRVESRGNPRAVSPVGAMGLMQIMPATWAMLTARFGLGGDAFDARANIHAGAAYLRLMWDRYGNVSAMLAAYNAGPGRADAWVARGNRLPAETVSYVARIAPAIGSGNAVSNVAGVAAVVAVPPSWRSASVFAVRTDGGSNTSDRPIARVSDDTPHAASSRVSSPTHPLFVTLSGAKRP